MPPTSDLTLTATVILDEGIDRELDYAIPMSLREEVAVGKRVRVPLRTSLRLGTIMGLHEKKSSFSLKAIHEILSTDSYIEPSLIQLGEWMADYYGCSFRKILRLFLPPSVRRGMEAKTTSFVIPNVEGEELARLHASLQQKNPAQARLVHAFLNDPEGILLPSLLLQTKSSRKSYQALIEQKILRCENREIHRDPLENVEYLPSSPKKLLPDQQVAFEKISQTIESEQFATHLLYGVTGSGKTEVYLQAIDYTLRKGKSAIFLVPEIALTSQTVERIRSRFRDKVALLHHRLSDGEKRDAWHAIHKGDIRIVLGARSAIFSPLSHLGLIVVDEEHEGAYKQTDESPCYHARDVSIMRGKLSGATVILGSATPSLETYTNALDKKYILSSLHTRPANARMPHMHIIDMRVETAKQKGSFLFSQPLLNAVESRLKKGEQSLLFLNRRGYHASRLCNACGETIKCSQCDLAMAYHRKENHLVCHLCHYHLTPPAVCPHCHNPDQQKFKGAGTEQVERALHAIFPDARVLRLDADTTRRKGSHEEAFKQFRSGKADILVGTQMVAKGIHFPNVTLVGALQADSGLHIPDFRAAERVYQLVTQVAGRAGRSGLAGEVFIQTWLPNHPAIALAASGSYTDFYAQEIEARQLFGYPPFSRLVRIILSGEDATAIHLGLERLREVLIQKLPPTYSLLPAVPCGYAKVKGCYRFQIIVKGPSCPPVIRMLKETAIGRLVPPAARLFVDCDPISTFF